jgi:hypothetical protein
MIPTPIQAQTLWLHTEGRTTAQIAASTGRTLAAVTQALTEARRVATAAGLRMVVIRPKNIEETGTGLSGARRLAKEAGLLP